MAKTLYLLRHCHATGQEPDASLTPHGKAQAQELSRFFEKLEVRHIITSPFDRAIQSIIPTAENFDLTVEIDNRLIERRWFSDKPVTLLEQIEESLLEKEVHLATGESSTDALKQVMQVLEEAPDRTIISFHGNILGLLLFHLEGLSGLSKWTKLSHPDIYKLQTSDDRYFMERIWNHTVN